MGARAGVVAMLALVGCSVPTSPRQQPDAGSDAAPTAPRCGDGKLDPGEICDDGNTADADGCSSRCDSDETCGNGYLDVAVGEACDDSNASAGDGCSADCKSDETCGNNVVDASRGETCDFGDTRPGDGCDENCNFEAQTFLIDAAHLINQDVFCDGTGNNRFDDCNGQPTGFTWDDHSLFTPTAVLLEFDNGIDCFNVSADATVCPGTPEGCSGQSDDRSTTLNGVASGTFAIVPGNCFCEPADGINPHNNNAFALVDVSGYVVGGTNQLLLAGAPAPTDANTRANCFGYSNVLFEGSYARITVFP